MTAVERITESLTTPCDSRQMMVEVSNETITPLPSPPPPPPPPPWLALAPLVLVSSALIGETSSGPLSPPAAARSVSCLAESLASVATVLEPGV
eukprot:SAG22_NODE_742_length_7506_cov_16.663561_2_plen_94_part_00